MSGQCPKGRVLLEQQYLGNSSTCISYKSIQEGATKMISSAPDKPDEQLFSGAGFHVSLTSFKPNFPVSNFSNIYLCFLFPGNRHHKMLSYSSKIEEIKAENIAGHRHGHTANPRGEGRTKLDVPIFSTQLLQSLSAHILRKIISPSSIVWFSGLNL